MSLATADAAVTPVTAEAVFAALRASWPPLRWHAAPGWRVAEGAASGRRTSCAEALEPGAEIAAMEALQARLGQPALVRVCAGEETLDAALAGRGYGLLHPTAALLRPIGDEAPPAPVTAFEVALPPLEAQREIWAAGGIGPARLEVMARAEGPKVTLLGRVEDTPCATAFAAISGGIAVVHALEVAPAKRRKGVAARLMQAAACWAEKAGARALCVFVTRDNAAAMALYHRLGLREVAGYHYRLKEELR